MAPAKALKELISDHELIMTAARIYEGLRKWEMIVLFHTADGQVIQSFDIATKKEGERFAREYAARILEKGQVLVTMWDLNENFKKAQS